MTSSPAAAEVISVDAAVTAVLSGPDGVLTWKEEQRTILKSFLCEDHVFALLFTPGSTDIKKCNCFAWIWSTQGLSITLQLFHPLSKHLLGLYQIDMQNKSNSFGKCSIWQSRLVEHLFWSNMYPLMVCLWCRWLDILRHRLPLSDGSTGRGAESTGAGSDPTLVHHAAAEWLPRAPKQTCRHMLLLLGGSYAWGTDSSNRCRQAFTHVSTCSMFYLLIFCAFAALSLKKRIRERFKHQKKPK